MKIEKTNKQTNKQANKQTKQKHRVSCFEYEKPLEVGPNFRNREKKSALKSAIFCGKKKCIQKYYNTENELY